MNDPVLVEVLRGGIVESFHRGALAVVDADGALVLGLGAIDRPVFARSSIKGFQALPLIESGAADRFALSDAEIALACASHSGEVNHAATAASMLKKAGLDATCLECGAHWPMSDTAARALAASGAMPNALHNNCSGKHSGFVCVALAMGQVPQGYIAPEHQVMQEVTAAIGDMTGQDMRQAEQGIDGCSIPTFALPLKAIATGFARFGTGQGLGPERAKAASRLRRAVANAPFMVAGTKRFDSLVMAVLAERAFIKMGAEGVFCAALPEIGLGIALKIEDGANRAAETVMAALLARFLVLDDHEQAVLNPFLDQPLTNWNGLEVGRIRPAAWG
jgi:L-asparaginase II